MRRGASSSIIDWTELCADAAVGSLAALAGVPNGRLVSDPSLRRLLGAVAAEAEAAARRGGLRVSGRPGLLAARSCRARPGRRHPWLRALRAGRPTGAGAALGRLLAAARRGGSPAPSLTVIAAVLRRLES